MILYGAAGETRVQDPELAYVNMLIVKREGIEYDFVPELPTGRQVFYERGAGRLWFDPANPFNSPITDLPVTINDFESVFVIFET